MPEIRCHGDREAALEAVAAEMIAALESALADGPAARGALCLSGGSSPVPLYRALSARPVPWDRVDLCPSDERWVPVESPDSNEGMLRRELLAGPAASARLHGLYRDAAPVDDAAPRVAADLDAQLDRRFDYCLLGMGADGHTASLFPDAARIGALLDSTAAVEAVHVPRLDVPRITLTPRRLLRARGIGLLLFGQDKLAVLERAMVAGPAVALPVRCVLHQDAVPVTCHWAP
jgi:6-phosphogluconolactonase